jgi:type 1 glutamine amidotransferase
MKKTFFIGLLTGLLILASPARAVTDDEIRKIEQAMPAAGAVEPAQPRTLLVFSLSNGFKHSSIPYWQKTLEIMAAKTGAFKVVQSSDMAVFDAESLKAFDAICFNNTTKLVPDQARQKAILDFIASGKGIVGIHAATDNFDDWHEGAMMMGGVFKGHPWTADGTWAIKIDEPDHPLMKPFGGKGFKISDEIYRTLPPHYSRTNQRVLMSLDMSDPATKNAKGVTPEDMDTGISWIKRVGKGRLFYCSLGHNHHVTWTTPVLEHYLAGIQYAMGDLKVDDAPVSAAADAETERLRSLVSRISNYHWDQSRAALAEMEQLVRDCSSEPDKLKAIEAVLLESLRSESTDAAKDFICRMLSTFGTEKSVPVLSQMLNDDATFDIAKMALDKIPGGEAESALLTGLNTVKDPRQKAALITSLGMRRSERAVASIAEALKNNHAVVSEAVVEALGSIASSEAIAALTDTAASNESLQERSLDALLRSAEMLSRSGQTKQARQVYEMLYAKGSAPQIRSGALLGLAATSAPKLNEYVMSALRAGDPKLCRAAVKVIAESKDRTLLEQAVGMAETLPPGTQVQLVTALSENPLRIGRQAAEKLAGSPHKDTRLAAFDALSVLGREESILLLSSAAASAGDRDERQAAQNALYAVPGIGADRTILAGIGDEQISEGARIELIQAAVQRQIANSSQALLKTARSANPKIASQSIRALQSAGRPQDVEALTKLVIDFPGANTENALTAAALRIEDAGSRASALLSQYGQTDSAEAKASLLRVMGKLGDRHSRKLINSQFDSNDPLISEAAFRAMTDWPGADFAARMKDVAQSATDLRMQVMAYRAYVRMLGTDSAALIDAYAIAPRPEEQKAVIGALAGCDSEQALLFVRKLSENSDLKTEAQMCMIGICEKLKASNAAAAAPVLRELADSGSTDAVKKRASELLK